MTIDETPLDRPSLHHVGIIVPDMAMLPRMAAALGLRHVGGVTTDTTQRVRVAFLAGATEGMGLLELVEPLGADSPAAALAQKGGGIHHICYEVGDLDGWVERAKRDGMLLVAAPVPASAFDGRRIAWMYSRDRLLVEYLER
jgi:methylmalonyl-CoA/ethylmalonyl-CoA epimerase